MPTHTYNSICICLYFLWLTDTIKYKNTFISVAVWLKPLSHTQKYNDNDNEHMSTPHMSFLINSVQYLLFTTLVCNCSSIQITIELPNMDLSPKQGCPIWVFLKQQVLIPKHQNKLFLSVFQNYIFDCYYYK